MIELRALLSSKELGVAASDPTLVQRVRNLTEGYPWFAVLLSRALKDDPTILLEGSDDWDAAKIAIAGPKSEYGDDSAAWEGEVLLRAKAMLAIVLTEDIDWRHLSPDVQEKLVAVFETKWSTLLGAAERCWQRGIVRMMQNWRYK